MTTANVRSETRALDRKKRTFSSREVVLLFLRRRNRTFNRRRKTFNRRRERSLGGERSLDRRRESSIGGENVRSEERRASIGGENFRSEESGQTFLRSRERMVCVSVCVGEVAAILTLNPKPSTPHTVCVCVFGEGCGVREGLGARRLSYPLVGAVRVRTPVHSPCGWSGGGWNPGPSAVRLNRRGLEPPTRAVR